MKVALFFFRPWLGAGSTTFTAHLFNALRVARATPEIYRVSDSPLVGAQPFGGYEDITYSNISMAAARAIAKSQPSVMTAVVHAPHAGHAVIPQLQKLGMRTVIHDDGEAAAYDPAGKPGAICVRQHVSSRIPGSVFIGHPYGRRPAKPAASRSGAVSTARIAASKRTSMLLDANRILPAGDRVQLLGMEDRLYSKSLQAQYADVYVRGRAGPKFPLTFDAPLSACASAALNVDLSYFANDGGGTQYAQLEAMDAGCVNVMHADWFRFPGEMQAGVHALAVADAASLAALVQSPPADKMASVIAASQQLLNAHSYKVIGRAYVKELRRHA